jgi:hypothetical protein
MDAREKLIELGACECVGDASEQPHCLRAAGGSYWVCCDECGKPLPDTFDSLRANSAAMDEKQP